MTSAPLRASLIALVVANLLPVAGVLFLGWSVFELVALYWFENVVIGAFNVVKILLAAPEPGEGREGAAGPVAMHAAKLFLVPFFTVHYGMFCLVHGIFVAALLGPGGMTDGGFPNPFGMVALLVAAGGGWMVAAVVLSHGFSFFTHYLGRGEFRRSSLNSLMSAPYGRIVVLHVAILFGGFAIQAAGSPMPLLLLLVAGKIALDGKLHIRAHR